MMGAALAASAQYNPFRVEKYAERKPKVAPPRNLGLNDSIPLGRITVAPRTRI